jgi:hypothetical protein
MAWPSSTIGALRERACCARMADSLPLRRLPYSHPSFANRLNDPSDDEIFGRMQDDELNRGFANRFSRLEQLIREDGKTTRSLIDAFAKDMKGRIKLIAEGYDALRTDVTGLKSGQERLEEGQDRLEIRISAVESRVADVEKTEKVVLTEVRGLATKVNRLKRSRASRARRS